MAHHFTVDESGYLCGAEEAPSIVMFDGFPDQKEFGETLAEIYLEGARPCEGCAQAVVEHFWELRPATESPFEGLSEDTGFTPAEDEDDFIDPDDDHPIATSHMTDYR